MRPLYDEEVIVMRPRALDLVAESRGSTEKVHVASCGSGQIHGCPPLPTNQPIHAFLSSPIPWPEPPPVTWAPGCSERGGVRPCAMALLTCDCDLQQVYVVPWWPGGRAYGSDAAVEQHPQLCYAMAALLAAARQHCCRHVQ